MLKRLKGLSGAAKAQALRFVRLTALSAFAIWVANGKHLDATAAWGAVVGGGEVVLRSWRSTELSKFGDPVSWSSPPVGAPFVVPADPAPVTAPVVPAPVSAPVVVPPVEAVDPEPPVPPSAA